MMNESNLYDVFLPDLHDASQGLGYVVGLREMVDSGETFAWVQRVTRTTPGEWKNRGTFQRSRLFPSLQAAKAWAFPEAKRRMAR